MNEKTKNLLKALFFLVFALFCLGLALTGTTHGSYPYLGTVLGLLVAIAFLRKALEK